MCPRTQEQNEEIRRSRIRQIQKAAAEVFLTKGILMEIRDVAVQAGLGYGTVYHYYKNKQVLFADLMNEALEHMQGQLSEALRHGGTPNQRLRRASRTLLTSWMQHPGTFILFKMMSEDLLLLPPERFNQLEKQFDQQLYQPIVRLFREQRSASESKKAEWLANILLGSLVGSAGLYMHRRRHDLDVDGTIDALFAGIAE